MYWLAVWREINNQKKHSLDKNNMYLVNKIINNNKFYYSRWKSIQMTKPPAFHAVPGTVNV